MILGSNIISNAQDTQGKYDDEVFEGLTQAILTKYDKEERGVGMQNFKYSPAYEDFVNIIRITSPAAYRTFKEWFPAKSFESFRQKEARKPKFPMEICDRTFELAATHLKSLGYKGPVSVCCDDAKLFASLRLYWDPEKKKHFLIGGSNGPVEVNDPESVDLAMKEATIQKATKIRIWCMTVQAPWSTPIVLHAMPLGTGLTAEKLEPYTQELIRGLIAWKIQVVSYACDGTEIERKIQALLVEHGDSRIEHIIPPPKSSGEELKIIIPVFDNQPVAMIQDSKHALKTFRNNLYSGARLLVLGNHTAFYAQAHKLAHDPGMDPLALASFPDDDQIRADLVPVAFDQADQLMIAVGIQPSRLRNMRALRQRGVAQIPSISSWYRSETDILLTSEDEHDEHGVGSWNIDSISEAEELQQLLVQSQLDELQWMATQAQLVKIQNLAYAAVALQVDEHMKVQAFTDQEEHSAEFDEECLELRQFQAADLTSPSIRPIITTPSIFGRQGVSVTSASSFDYSVLIELRRAHQTYQAEHGVRTSQSESTPGKESPRAKIIKAMRNALKEAQEQGLTTGVGRSLRTKALGSKEESPALSGNAANVVAAASSVDKMAARKRRDIFTKAKLKRLHDIVEARVSSLTPLRVGDFTLVAANPGDINDIFLAKVLMFYAKGGGKHGKHDAVLDSKSSISAFSYIAVQLFEHSGNNRFTSRTEAGSLLETVSYALLPSIHVLARVQRPDLSSTSDNHTEVQLGQGDTQLYIDLQGSRDNIFTAIALYKKQSKKDSKENDVEE
ncbi:hypothetical protein LENED_012023 [Lentinula edodes]|uniref:Uncharacterized protein n=1 Tax=Lentinula edodes TaxID=5353 RepID=A0A1Q3ERK5_LENED|nr:hypothetical protein LENED_012023 [Lentinula edodes]